MSWTRGERFTLFADTLLVGLLVAVASLPVLTVLIALAAGCFVLRDGVDGGAGVTLARFSGRFVDAMRSGASGVLAPAAVLVVAGLDGLAVAAGLPGQAVVASAIAAALAAVVVVGLRAAALWQPGARWDEVFATAARAAVSDPSGSLLLIGAAGCSLLLAVEVRFLVLLVAGPLVLAAVAVERRRQFRRPSPE